MKNAFLNVKYVHKKVMSFSNLKLQNIQNYTVMKNILS